MPYDAPDYKTVLWDERGSPYWKTASGKKTYIPPLVAAQMRDEPRAMEWAKSKGVTIDYQTNPETGEVSVGAGGVVNNAAPGGGLFHKRGQWNSETGEWDTPLDWGNILSMAIAGGLTAGAATAMMGGGAAAETAVSTALSTGSAEAGMAAAAPLASTAIGTGIATLPAVAASGAVPAALAGGGAAAAGGALAAGGGLAAGESAAAAPLASTTIAPLAGTTPAGIASGTGAASMGASLTGAASTPSTLSTIGRIANASRDVGGAISNASSAAGANRRDDARFGLNAQGTYENALFNRAELESRQRKDALKDIYRSSFYKNERPGPYDVRGVAPVSPEYLSALSGLEQQGLARLKPAPEYDTTKFKPLVEKDIPPASGLEKAGSWVGPTLSTIAALSSYYK